MAIVVLVVATGDDESPPTPGADSPAGTVVGDSPETYLYHDRLTTAVGERAVVTNDDDTPHTYTADGGLFDSGPLAAGEAASFPSLPAGTYPYHCEIHPALTGELVVRD